MHFFVVCPCVYVYGLLLFTSFWDELMHFFVVCPCVYVYGMPLLTLYGMN